jgi:hypothetical protein
MATLTIAAVPVSVLFDAEAELLHLLHGYEVHVLVGGNDRLVPFGDSDLAHRLHDWAKRCTA